MTWSWLRWLLIAHNICSWCWSYFMRHYSILGRWVVCVVGAWSRWKISWSRFSFLSNFKLLSLANLTWWIVITWRWSLRVRFRMRSSSSLLSNRVRNSSILDSWLIGIIVSRSWIISLLDRTCLVSKSMWWTSISCRWVVHARSRRTWSFFRDYVCSTSLCNECCLRLALC